MAVSVPLDLKLQATECAFCEGMYTAPIIVGHTSESDLALTLDGDPAPLEVCPNGDFIIDLSNFFLKEGAHKLKIQYINFPNLFVETYLFVFCGVYIISTKKTAESNTFLKTQSLKSIGIAIGFFTMMRDEKNPFRDIKVLENTLDSMQLWTVYGYALRVLEFFNIRQFESYHDFEQDIVLLSADRATVPQLYDQLMKILGFPKPTNQSININKETIIDLAKLVSNHEDGFRYEILNHNILGDIELRGTCLRYVPPSQPYLALPITESIVFSVTGLSGKSAKGKIKLIYEL